jgi:hypothetical protein
MIKCEECGHDNPLGSIFCRQCGGKLDIENIKPTLEPKSKMNIINLVRNLIGGIILLVVVWIIGSMAIPQSSVNRILDEDGMKKADEKLDFLLAKIKGKFGENKYTFSPDELTYLYNAKLTASETGDEQSYQIGNVYFSTWGEQVVILMETKLLGVVPVSFSIKGTIPENSTDLFVLNAKIGHYSVPRFMRNIVLDKFKAAAEPSSVQQIVNGVSSFAVEDGEFVVRVE